jgi:uncharacterized membrane protein
MTTADLFALMILIIAYFGYSFFYLHALASPRFIVRENLIDAYRRKWVETIARDKNGILGIQTLRNLEMVNTFLISLTMLMLGGIISIFSAKLNWMDLLESGNYIEFLKEHTVAIKLIVALFFILEAFYNFLFSLRVQFNMNFTVSMASEMKTDLNYIINQAIRQARYFILGIRALYFAIAPLVWIISPYAMILLLVVLVLSLFQFDFLHKKKHPDPNDKYDSL